MKVVTIGGELGAGKTTAMLRIAAGLPESHSCLYVVDTYDRIWYPAKVFGEMSSRPLVFHTRDRARPLDRYNDIFLDIDGPAPGWLSLVLLADGHVYVRQLTELPPAKDPTWRAAMEDVARHHTTLLDQLKEKLSALPDVKETAAAISAGVSSVVKERCDQIDSRVNALAESLSRRLDALEKQAGPVGGDTECKSALASLEIRLGLDAMRQLWLMDGGPALIQGWVSAGDQATETLAESIRAFMRSKGYVFKPFLADPFYAVPASPDPTAGYGDLFVSPPMGSGGSNSDSKDALIRDLMAQVGNSHTYPYVEWGDRILRLRDRAEKLGVRL